MCFFLNSQFLKPGPVLFFNFSYFKKLFSTLLVVVKIMVVFGGRGKMVVKPRLKF
jgi:hypothetical protein